MQFASYVVKNYNLENHEMSAETIDQESGATAINNDFLEHFDHDEIMNTDHIVTSPITPAEEYSDRTTENDTSSAAAGISAEKGTDNDTSSAADLYIVEKIVGERTTHRKKQYCVKWEGYGSSENTWEPAQKLKNNQILLKYLADKRKQKT